MSKTINRFTLFQLSILIGTIGGLLKYVIGNTYILLISDLLLWYILLSNTYKDEYLIITNNSKSFEITIYCAFLLFLIAIAQMFNPNINNIGFSFIALRVSIYIIIYVFVGIRFYRQENNLKYFFENFLPYIIVFSSFFAILEFFFPSIQMFNALTKQEFISNDPNHIFFSTRVSGLYVGPVQLSLFAGLLFLITTVKMQYTKPSIWGLFILIFSLIILTLSKSRAVLFSVLLISLLFILMSNKGKIFSKLLKSLSIFFLVLCIIYIIMRIYLDQETITYLLGRFTDSFHPNSVNGSSFHQGRIVRWTNEVFPLILKHPFGLGTGFSQSFYDEFRSNYYIKPIITESIFFDVFIDQGFIAGILFMFITVYSIILSFNAFLRKDQINIYCAIVILLFIIPGITSPNLAAFPYTYLFATSLGILITRNKYALITSI